MTELFDVYPQNETFRINFICAGIIFDRQSVVFTFQLFSFVVRAENNSHFFLSIATIPLKFTDAVAYFTTKIRPPKLGLVKSFKMAISNFLPASYRF